MNTTHNSNTDEIIEGDRVETVGLSVDDADTGVVYEIRSDGMVVGWDSGVTTLVPAAVAAKNIRRAK